MTITNHSMGGVLELGRHTKPIASEEQGVDCSGPSGIGAGPSGIHLHAAVHTGHPRE